MNKIDMTSIWAGKAKGIENLMLDTPIGRDGRFKQLTAKKELCNQAVANLRYHNEKKR